MSMLDAFFNKGFKGDKCKTLLKLSIPRIKLLRNRREIQLKQMRRDIAKLLENGQEATARIRVEHIIREENMMAAQEIIELFCELIAVRLPIIETQRECPLDLKEAISSICFAAPRCSDLPELQQIQMMFTGKYGKEFVAAATELMPDCGVNRQIIELLSVRAPSVEAKLKLLKEIAEEHEVDWDPAASETEFLKPREDLLNDPNHFLSGSATLPLPHEKLDHSISSEHTEGHHEEADSDAGFDSLDLLEVPKASVRTTSDTPSAPATSPSTIEGSTPHPFDTDSELTKSKPSKNVEGEVNNPETLPTMRENKQFQFVPFVASPPPPYELPSEQSDTTPRFVAPPPPPPPPPPFDLPSELSDTTPAVPHGRTPRFVASPPPPPLSLPSELSDTTQVIPRDPTPQFVDSPPSPSHVPFPSKQSNPTTFLSGNSLPPSKTEANIDLQDVLAAVQATVETADRAAAAARAAVSLARVRIAELITKKIGSSEKNGSAEHYEDIAAKPTSDQQNSFDRSDHSPHYEPVWGSGSPGAMDHSHQPQRSVSLEEDAYFSYPNLFTRQDSGLKPDAHSSDEHSR